MKSTSKSDVVAEVLAINERLRVAACNADARAFEELLSRDLVVSDPSNTIRHKDDLIALFSKGEVAYTSIEVTVDYASELGDLVVIMGTESSTQTSVPVDSGLGEIAIQKTLHRRFTNIFRREENAWRLLVKQSTIFSIE
jgi:ketosteroid isomerase-like protein